MSSVLVLLAVFASCNAIRLHQMTDCGSAGARVNSVDADWCTKEPCTVRPGGSYPLHINFTATTDITAAHNSIHAIVLGFNIPVHSPNENACSGGIQCPVRSGTTVVLDYTLQCPSYTPQVTLTLKWEVKDAHGKDIICVTSPVHVHA